MEPVRGAAVSTLRRAAMEYEIEEEDLLFDRATSNPSLLRP